MGLGFFIGFEFSFYNLGKRIKSQNSKSLRSSMRRGLEYLSSLQSSLRIQELKGPQWIEIGLDFNPERKLKLLRNLSII